MRGVALLLLPIMAACVDSGGVSQPSVTLVEQCSAESGFTARAAAARASGVLGDIPGTPKELAAINACVKAKSLGQGGSGGAANARVPVKPAATPVPTAQRACRNTMVGGDGYACMPI